MNTPASRVAAVALALVLASLPATAQTGHVLNGVGPIDQGLSGAGMAHPQDALTALHWNPASLFAIPGKSLDFSLQVMKPTGTLSSSVETGAFGMVPNPVGGMMPFPWTDLEGKTDSDAGLFPIPSVGYLHSTPGSRFAFGLSAFGVGGFGVDYALSPMDMMAGQLPENPLVSPQQADGGIGFGALSSTFMLLQVSPTVAFRLTDDLSVGFAPTFNMASLELSVFPGTAPQMFPNPIDPSGTSMLALYPDAPAAWATGLGFQAGLHYVNPAGFSAGVSYKSRQAFQEFAFEPTTPGAADYEFRMDYPMILSGAVAFTGIDGLLLAADVRYIDFENAPGFDKSGFGMQGQVLGFGWKSITVVALGAQYEVLPGLPVRFGYSMNGSPVEDDAAFFNTPAPAIIEQHVSGGFSYDLTEKISLGLAAQIGLANDISGAWKTINPANGATISIPETGITNELSTLTVIGGVHVRL